MKFGWQLLCPLSMALALTLACDRPASPSNQTPPRIAAPAPTPVEDGHNLFLAYCSSCHGKNADGDTPAGRAWQVPNLRAAKVQSLSGPQLLQVIAQGKGRMPAWEKLLSPADRDHLLVYVRSLHPAGSAGAPPAGD